MPTSPIPTAPYTTITDAAAERGLHPRTLRRAIDDGDLAAYKFGRALRIRVADLEAWDASKLVQPGEADDQ